MENGEATFSMDGVVPARPADNGRPATPVGWGERVVPNTALPQALPAPVGATPSRSYFGRSTVLELIRQSLRGDGAALPNGDLVYAFHFKVATGFIFVVSILWIGNFLLAVMPVIRTHQNAACRYTDKQLKYNATMLFVYFVWFFFARLSLFTPSLARRVVWIQTQAQGGHGFCRSYCVHLVLRDGPLYIFVIGSLLFWIYLKQSPVCEETGPDFYLTLKLYAVYSNGVSVLCLIFAYWHNKILNDFAGDVEEAPFLRGAPPDLIGMFETCPPDQVVAKRYAEECAICLGTWEAADCVKVTPCGHAYHRDCIGNWLKTARTCALCRQDLVTMVAERQNVAQAQALGRPDPNEGVVAGGSRQLQPTGPPGVVPVPPSAGSPDSPLSSETVTRLEDV